MPEDVMSKLGKAREELSGMGNDDLAKSLEEIEKSFRGSGTAAVFLSGVIRDLTKDGSKLSTKAKGLVEAFRLFKSSIDGAKKSASSLSKNHDFDKTKASVHGVVKEVASLSKELSKASKIEFKSIDSLGNITSRIKELKKEMKKPHSSSKTRSGGSTSDTAISSEAITKLLTGLSSSIDSLGKSNAELAKKISRMSATVPPPTPPTPPMPPEPPVPPKGKGKVRIKDDDDGFENEIIDIINSIKTAKLRVSASISEGKINSIKADKTLSEDDKDTALGAEKSKIKSLYGLDKIMKKGNQAEIAGAEDLFEKLNKAVSTDSIEELSSSVEKLSMNISNSDHEIDNFNGLLEELEKKAKSARSEIDDIFGGVPTGALAGIAALLLLEKGIEKLTDMFSDAAVDIAKMRYEIKKSEAAYKKMFAGNDLSSFARSLNMTNKELSELGGEFGEINNALIRSNTSFSKFSGMLQNVRNNIGKVDSGEIKKVAEILNSLSGAQVDVMINGVGNMDDAANMLMNLMNNDKLDVAIEMMAKGSFGDVENKDKLEMSEVDRKVIESQEYANKLLEDIRLYMFNMSSQMVPFVTENLPYLGAMTKVLSSSAARTIASVIFLKNISNYAKGLNGTVWNRAVRTRDAASTGGIESDGKKSWKGIATSVALLAGGAYLYAKGSKEVATERREWAKKTSVLDHGFGDEQSWSSNNDANSSRNIGKIMMGAAAGAETARLAASSAGLSEEMASLAAKFGLLAGAVSGAYSALKDTHVSADTEETHSVTVKMLETYGKNYGEMLKKNRSELYQSMIAMRDFKNVLKALEGDISFSSSVLKKETAEALINNVAQGGGTSATGIQAYNDVVSSSVDIYSKTTEILNRSRLDVLRNEKISGAARSNLLNLSVQEQAKALNKFTQAILSTAGKFAEITGILKNIKMADAQIDFNTLIGESGVAGLVTSSSTDLYDEAGRNLSAASVSFAQELERLSSSFLAADEANKGMIEQIKRLEKETASRKSFGLKSIVKEDGTIDDKALKGNAAILDAKQKEAEDSINRKAKAADKVGIAASILNANQAQTDMQELIKGLSANDGKKGEGLEKNRELAQKSFDQLKDVFVSTGDKGSTKALEEALGGKNIDALSGEELHNLVKQMGEISTQNLIKLETNNQKFFQSIASERKNLDDIQKARAPQQIAANVVDTDALQTNAYADTLSGLVKFQKDINSQTDNLVNLMNKGGLENFYGKEAEYLDSVAEWALVNGHGVENAEKALETTQARIENARTQRSKYKSELNAGVDKSVTNLKDNFSADSDALKPLDDSQKTAAIAYRDSQIKLQEAFKSGDVDAVTKAQKEAEEAADVMGSFIKSLSSGTDNEKKTAKKLEMLANAMAVGSTAASKAFEGIRESELNEKSLSLKQVQDIKKKVDVRESERAPEQELVDTMLDYANDIGLPFEKILELEAQTVNLARERFEDELTALQEMKAAGAGQLEIKRQEAQVAKTQAELSKKSLGAQRSAMDKMMGSILGTFSDFAGIAGDLNEAAVFGQGRVTNSAGLVVGNVGKNGGWENRQFNAQSGSGSDSQYSPFNYGETKRKKVPGFANGGKVYDLSKEGTITGGPTTGDKMLASAPNKPVWILNKEQQGGFDSIDKFANGGSANGIVRVNAGERVVSVKDMVDRAHKVGLSNDKELFEKLSSGKSDSIDKFANGGSARGNRNWHGHSNTQTIDREKESELLAIERVYGSVLRGGANEMVLAELSKEYNLILRDNPGLRESKRLQMSSLEKTAKSKLEEKHRKIEGQSIDIMSDMLAGRGKSVSTKQKMLSDGLNETPSAKSFVSKMDIERAGLAENNGVVNPVSTESAVADNSVVGLPLIDTPEADKKFEKLRISESNNNLFSETAQGMRFLEASGISGKVTKPVANAVGSVKDLAIEATKGITSKLGKLIKLKKASLPATEIFSNTELMYKFTKAGGKYSDITGFIESGRSADDFMRIYNSAPDVADAVKVFAGGANSSAAKMIDGAKLAKLSKASKLVKGVGTKATGIAKKLSVGKTLGAVGSGLEAWRGVDEFKRSDKGFADWANLGLTGADAADQLAGSRGKGGNLSTGMLSLVAGMGVGATMSEEQMADFFENELFLKDANVVTNLMRLWDRKSLAGKGVGAMVGKNVRMGAQTVSLLKRAWRMKTPQDEIIAERKKRGLSSGGFINDGFEQINVSGASKGIDDGVLVRVSNGKESIVKNEWLDNLTPYVMGGLGTTKMSNEDMLKLAAGGSTTTGGIIGRGGIRGFRNTGSPGRSKTNFGFDPITSTNESSDTESILKDILRVNIEAKDIFAAAFGVDATVDDDQKSKWESIKEVSRKQTVAMQPIPAMEDDYSSKIVKAVEESTIYICDSVRSISEGLKLIRTTAPQFGIAQSPVPSSADGSGSVQVVGEVEVKSNVTVKVVQDEGNLRTFVVKVVEESPAAIGRALLSGSKN